MSADGTRDVKPPLRLLRLPEVTRLTGLGRSMIYQLQAEQRFPQSIKLGTRAVAWIEHEVQAWLAERIARTRGPNNSAAEWTNGKR